MKLFLVIALAKYLHDDPRSEGRTLKDLVVPALIAGVPTALVLLQPDLGTALILVLVFADDLRAHARPEAARLVATRRAPACSSARSSGATACAATRTSASTRG